MANQNEVTLDDALAIAKKAHQAGNLTLADRTYKDIIKVYPDNFTSLHFLGIIAYQRKSLKEGIGFIEKAIQVNDNNPETWNAYAVMLEMSGKREEAIKAWDKALALSPHYPDALSNYGNACWSMGDFEKAKSLCEKAIQIKPDFAAGYINLGNAYLSLGSKERAIEQWKKSIELYPANSFAYTNIGNALRDLGRIKEAEEHCRKALEFTPDHPEALLNLANALRDQRQFEEAEASYRRATQVKPDYVQAHNNLSILMMDMFRFDEALTSVKYALAFDPECAEAYGNMSVILRETGKLSEAEDAARKALNMNPDSAEARIDLAEVLFQMDHYEEVITLLNEAMDMKPDSPRIYMKLSSALERTNRIDDAIVAINKAVELNPEMPEAYQMKGTTYFMSNHMDEAIAALDKALELKSDSAEAYALKSEVMQSKGDMEKAREYIEHALAINNRIPSLYMGLSKLKKFSKDDPEIQIMLELTQELNKYGRVHGPALYYALHKAFSDIKEYDKAFEYLKKGADLKRQSVSYNAQTQSDYANSIRKFYSKEFVNSFKGKGYEDDTPVFIVGMPRSGTTLTEQIISSHPDVYGAGELYALSEVERDLGSLNQENAKEWGRTYIDKIRAIDSDSRKAKKITDKMPGNFIRMGQIFAALPHAKVIHCRRNPMDTCLSCYKQLFARGQYWSYNLDEMANYYDEYEKTMEHWRKNFSGRFIEVDYEETINDFENQARRLIDFVGLEWNDACLTPHKSERSVLTASKGQVRQPIYKTSIEAWRRHEQQLQPLYEKLKKYMPA